MPKYERFHQSSVFIRMKSCRIRSVTQVKEKNAENRSVQSSVGWKPAWEGLSLLGWMWLTVWPESEDSQTGSHSVRTANWGIQGKVRFLWDLCLTHQDVEQKKFQGEPGQDQQVSLLSVFCVWVRETIWAIFSHYMFSALVLCCPCGLQYIHRIDGPSSHFHSHFFTSQFSVLQPRGQFNYDNVEV